MQFCSNCGEKMDTGVVFCPNCGTQSTQVKEKPPVSINKKAIIIIAAIAVVLTTVIIVFLLRGGSSTNPRELVGHWENPDERFELMLNADGTGRFDDWGDSDRISWRVVDGLLEIDSRTWDDAVFFEYRLSGQRLTLTYVQILYRVGGRGSGLVGTWEQTRWGDSIEIEFYADGTGRASHDWHDDMFEWSSRNGRLSIIESWGTEIVDYRISGQRLILIDDSDSTVLRRRDR